MIGGYILPTRSPYYENIFCQNNSVKVKEYLLEAGENIGWFVHVPNIKLATSSVFFSKSHLFIVDGVAVVQDSYGKYRFFNPLTDYSFNDCDPFSKSIDKIVSNVNVISVIIDKNKIVLNIASHRASCGRIWYMQPPEKNGIIISDDFRLLMKLGMEYLHLEPRSIYAILKYGVSPDPITIIKNISSIPSSHFGTFTSDNSKIVLKPYFQFSFPETNGYNLETVSNALKNSAQFLKSLNPILLVSGGVDSTLFANYLCEDNKDYGDISAYFLSFGKEDPELKFAQEAAGKTELILDTIFMDEKDVLAAITQISKSYMHPFSDYSTIPTYFLINHIKNKHPYGGILIDGTGADGCFGFEDLTLEKMYKLAQLQPRLIKRLSKIAFNNLVVYRNETKIARLLSLISRSEKDIQLVPLVSDVTDLFIRKETSYYDEDIDSAFLRVFNSSNESNKKNTLFKSKVTVADISVACRAMALKDYNIGREPFIEIIYPYLWKDILSEQGKLSWDCKINKGIVKWPLKRLLEKYMDNDFIFRKKSGFVPPLSDWLKQKEIYSLFQDTILSPSAFISDMIKVKSIKNLIYGLPKNNRPIPASILSFLWGALFVELWLQQNYKPLTFR